MILNLVIIYYITIFCSIYSESQFGWFNDTVIAMFIDYFIITPIICLVKTIVKVSLRTHFVFRPLLIVDHLFFLLNFFI